MEKPHYIISSSSDGFWYEFDSISREKTLRKAVAYYQYSGEIYQLVFGNLKNQSIDTLDKSNNQDMIKVLILSFKLLFISWNFTLKNLLFLQVVLQQELDCIVQLYLNY
jgi:hypothetical protein